MVGSRRNLQGLADLADGLALVEHLFGLPELADDLYSYGEAFGYGLVAGVLNGASPGPVWPVGKLSLGLDQFPGPTSAALNRQQRQHQQEDCHGPPVADAATATRIFGGTH